MKNSIEYKRFDSAMTAILSVPHGDIKAKLDEEKKTRKRKPKKSSASARA